MTQYYNRLNLQELSHNKPSNLYFNTNFIYSLIPVASFVLIWICTASETRSTGFCWKLNEKIDYHNKPYNIEKEIITYITIAKDSGRDDWKNLDVYKRQEYNFVMFIVKKHNEKIINNGVNLSLIHI